MERGSGAPVVVIDAALGMHSLHWAGVQKEAARTTTVCTYDRAGYGWSDGASWPRTSRRIADELHLLLDRAGLPPPYVLVGHSLGGLNVRVFAHDHRDLVAGMVLVDASHEDMLQRMSGGDDP